jgi:primosomal protein N' (replication factor Y)
LFFYQVSLLGAPLSSLTYHFSESIELGSIVSCHLKTKEYLGVVLSTCHEPEYTTQSIESVSDSFFSSKQIALAEFIASYYVCSVGDALGLMVPFVADPRVKPEDDEKVEPEDDDKIKSENDDKIKPENDDKIKPENDNKINCQGNDSSLVIPDSDRESFLELSCKQAEALSFLQNHKVSLLFGDTGSGKTEIYMKYFEEMIAQGKRSIFLMPEISLTPQMNSRLEAHFGDKVLMWHSKLTKLQKEKALKRLHEGSVSIIAGPRSALFLPVDDLGLIVVDEEHDDSYKSSSRPRYNARDLAIYMGKLYDVPVVLGSATPSLSSYVKFPYFRLKGGHFTTQKEFIYERAVESLTPALLGHLKKTLALQEQSIVFVPTRANFKHLICADCGYHYECAFCSVGMSVHNKMHALKCHYCNFTQAIPKVCSKCGSENLTSSRLGTAQALQDISEFLPEARVEQFDRDVITTQNKLKKALKRFNDKEIDILVGTQMLSKGHDYHDVTLAVVLGMDNMLNMSDYRAREKALSMLIQVAGRSGRKKSAKVLVQSFQEDFFKAYIGSYESFLEDEKEFRKELYPPYKKLCRILFSHKNGTKAKEAMQNMVAKLRNFKSIEVVGHGACAIERVADKWRFEILLRSDKSTEILKAIRTCHDNLAEIDMDPIEFG